MITQQGHSEGPSITSITDHHLPQLAKIAREYAQPIDRMAGPAVRYAPSGGGNGHDTRQRVDKFVDVVVSAPKSLSVLWAVHNRDEEVELLRGAHLDAVSQAAIDLQKQVGQARFGVAYLDVMLKIFRLEHYTNDQEAPYLHTHLIVDAEARDGGRRGLLHIPTLEDFPLIGLHYQACLEQELWRRLQLRFQEEADGSRQLCGVGPDLTDVYADGSCRIGFPQFTATA